ncbi:MAG: MFS transporter [Thermoleophilia bacterium]|nr:MFS transporter [Thermoleophilia bacterium]
MKRAVARLRPRGELWHNQDFRRLWAAQSVSQFGSQITGLALPLVAILVLDASTFEVAVLAVVDWMPFFLFSLPAGVWIDRLPRRPILIAADLGRAAVLSSIPLAYLLDALTLGQLYLVGLLAGTFTVFFDLSYQSYLPSLVRRDELGEGNSKLEVSRSGAQVAGPGIAGLLVSALTAPYAILVDAISFLGSAVLLARISRRERTPERPAAGQPPFLTEIHQGLRFVLRHPLLRPIVIFVGVSNVFVTMLFAIYLVYAVRDLGLDATTIGLIFSLGSLGSLVGALTATRVARAFGTGPGLIGVATVGGLGLTLIPLASGPLVIPFLIAGNVLWGFFVLNYFVSAISLIQAITPERLLGRTNASRRFLVQGVIPVGAFLGGALGSALGLRPTIAVGAIGASLAVIPLIFSPLRLVKTTNDAENLVRDYNESFAVAQ